MLADETDEVSWTQPILSTVSFGASRYFHSRLNESFTDSYVYAADWKKMIPSFVTKWKNALHMSLGFLMYAWFPSLKPGGALTGSSSGCMCCASTSQSPRLSLLSQRPA